VAIALRSGSEARQSGSADIGVPGPAGNTAGDTLVAFLDWDNSGATLTAPAGWTLVDSDASTVVGQSNKVAVYRRHLSGPIGTETWTLSGVGHMAAVILCYTGVDSVSPVEDSDNAKTTAAGTSLALPAMTATGAGARAVLGWGTYAANQSPAVSGLIAVLNPKLALVNASLAVFEEHIPAAGAYSSKTASWATSSGAVTVGVVLHELQVAPNAPLWVSPAAGSVQDVAAGLTLDWAFSDDNTADTQGAYALKRDVGGTVRWWGGSAFDQVAETYITSSATSLALASSWGADGDATHFYSVRTKDAALNIGPYSSVLAVVPDAKDNPTITALTTVTTATPAIEWTVTDQGQYRVQIRDDADSFDVWDSGWITSTSERGPITVGTTLEDVTDYIQRVTTKTAEGLTSDPSSDAFSTVFVPPDAPVVTVNEVDGAFEVTVENPATGEPVESNDLYVRIAAGSLLDGNRTTTPRRIAAGFESDTVITDYAVGSGVTYEYMARAWTADGAFTDSDPGWSIGAGAPGVTPGETWDGGSA